MPKSTLPHPRRNIEIEAVETRGLETRIIENIGGGERKTQNY